MGNRGLRASNRTPFRTARKRKASTVQEIRLWGKRTFTGEYDKKAVYFFLGIVAIILVIGGSILAVGPLFHSISKNNTPCLPESVKAPGAPCNDPSTVIWQATGGSSDLSEFNTNNLVGGTVSYAANCAGASTAPCILMAPGTNTSIAISNSQLGDLSSASKNLLAFHVAWRISGTASQFADFGYYLTTNTTIPLHNIGSSAAYDPRNDPSVVFVVLIECESSCSAASQSWFVGTYALRDLGVKGDTIASQDTGGCGAGSGSRFLCNTNTIVANSTQSNPETASYLNYTGVTNAGGCTFQNGVSIVPPSPGCSWSLNSAENNDLMSSSWVSTQQLPWFALQAQQYHIGFFTKPSSNTSVRFMFNTGSNGAMDVFTFVPQTTAPPIDTGGFFGPVIKALIIIGIFIAQNIINFLTFLYNLIAPLLASAASIIGAVLTAVMNALGSVFGDSSLGTQIGTAFTNIVNYLTNVFAGAVSIWSNILTGLLNILNFVVKFLTITVSGGATLFNFVEVFFSTLTNLWAVIVGVWNQFMKFYIAGSFTIQYILVGWWIWGIYENATSGIKDGLLDSWLHPSRTFLLGFFHAGYWLLDEAYKFVVQLKQLIFGNRISPGTIAGNG